MKTLHAPRALSDHVESPDRQESALDTIIWSMFWSQKSANFCGTCFVAGLLAGTTVLAAPALAAGLLTAANGMTLYVFDSDVKDMPTCYEGCAINWPPYLGKAGDKMPEGWTLVQRRDGAQQWAYDGKPLYFYKGDRKKGDRTGDGMAGNWHVVTD